MPLKIVPLPPRELLLSLFTHDDGLGVLIHNERPREMFRRDKDWKIWNTNWAGKVAGAKNSGGHIQVKVMGGTYLAHRLIWLMVYGEDPGDNEIDHIDTHRDNNRLSNLRLATRSNNQHNSKRRSNNTSGERNVYWRKDVKKWEVMVSVQVKMHSLGSYDKFEEAVEIARQAREALCGEFTNHWHGERGVCLESPDEFLSRIRKGLHARRRRNTSSGINGVSRVSRDGKWQAYACKDKKTHFFGRHATLEEAAEAARLGRIKLGLEK
jgi:hypothetical protein